ncbi:MAG: class I SAM-dependent methyltransferase [Limisphaerales bacterium]
MSTPLEQHNVEIQENLRAWENKPLLQSIYRDFYKKIAGLVDHSIDGRVLEIGSGIGNMKGEIPDAISSDLFPNPWLDLVCDGYDLPFKDNSLSHIILFDVFHHLEAPAAFLEEAKRVLKPRGRIIIFDPFISLASLPVYGLLHHEPVGWTTEINFNKSFPEPRGYYAAQGNATRLFFKGHHAGWMEGWSMFHAEAFSRFSYLFSGGFSKPAMYPAGCYPLLKGIDALLSFAPSLFGARCLVGLTPSTGEQRRWRSSGF